jgi:hypothetical protein
MLKSEQITWIDPSDELPDEEQTVLLFVPNASEPVWPGFLSDGVWCWADGGVIRETVVAYAELPAGPVELVGRDQRQAASDAR